MKKRARARRPPTRRAAPGSLAFVEFASADPPAARRFLHKVFGWKFRRLRMPAGDYLSFRTSDGGQGGIRTTRPGEPPSSLGYVRVRNLDQARKRVEESGGRIVLPRVDVPQMGSFFWFQIPDGPVLACWEDAPDRPRGR